MCRRCPLRVRDLEHKFVCVRTDFLKARLIKGLDVCVANIPYQVAWGKRLGWVSCLVCVRRAAATHGPLLRRAFTSPSHIWSAEWSDFVPSRGSPVDVPAVAQTGGHHVPGRVRGAHGGEVGVHPTPSLSHLCSLLKHLAPSSPRECGSGCAHLVRWWLVVIARPTAQRDTDQARPTTAACPSTCPCLRTSRS